MTKPTFVSRRISFVRRRISFVRRRICFIRRRICFLPDSNLSQMVSCVVVFVFLYSNVASNTEILLYSCIRNKCFNFLRYSLFPQRTSDSSLSITTFSTSKRTTRPSNYRNPRARSMRRPSKSPRLRWTHQNGPTSQRQMCLQHSLLG
jgi:hypothetical protein